MRTNIEIDEQLMQAALDLSGLPTKRAVVEQALRLLIHVKKQTGMRSLKGKVSWNGNLDETRSTRFGSQP
jgi:Arc/MetJ family transcription regulator